MSKITGNEKSLKELEIKIEELEKFSKESDVDLADEIGILKTRLEKMRSQLNSGISAWEKVKLARHKDRPSTLKYISLITDSFIEFHGDRGFADDPAIVGGIGLIEGMSVTVIGHQKGRDTSENIKRNFGMPNPEGYRKALRLMKQAEKFKRPVVTFIDTPGAFCGLGAEERGQAEAIAVNLLEMSRLKVPTIAIIIGEGGSGGALALGIGDKIAMLENSVYSVISPEGLASILWKDSKKAENAAEVMKLTSEEIKSFDVIDDIIEEPKGGAHMDAELMASNIKSYITSSLNELYQKSQEDLLDSRYKKIRSMGRFL